MEQGKIYEIDGNQGSVNLDEIVRISPLMVGTTSVDFYFIIHYKTIPAETIQNSSQTVIKATNDRLRNALKNYHNPGLVR